MFSSNFLIYPERRSASEFRRNGHLFLLALYPKENSSNQSKLFLQTLSQFSLSGRIINLATLSKLFFAQNKWEKFGTFSKIFRIFEKCSVSQVSAVEQKTFLEVERKIVQNLAPLKICSPCFGNTTQCPPLKSRPSSKKRTFLWLKFSTKRTSFKSVKLKPRN